MTKFFYEIKQLFEPNKRKKIFLYDKERYNIDCISVFYPCLSVSFY